MIQIINAKTEYYGNKLQKYDIIVPLGFDFKARENETKVVDLISSEFGGKIELLNEMNITGYKNPDFLWESKCWEIKSVSTKNSIDSQVRYALKQISKNVGGIVLLLDRCMLSIDEVIDVVCNRVKRTSSIIIPKVDVIFMRNIKIVDIIRLIKKDIPSAK